MTRCGRLLHQASVMLLLGMPASSSYVDRHVARGDALFTQRKYAQAIEEYERAVRFDPRTRI